MIFGKAAIPKESVLLEKKIKEAAAIAISGHTSPDGDCVGACLGLCTYIRDNYPEKTVDVYLEPIGEKFRFLTYADEIRQEKPADMKYDLYFSLDCSEPRRLGDFQTFFEEAFCKICIDHHITNEGFGDMQIIRPKASSTCEILFDLLDYEKISPACAQDLYLGIVHDTGVFKHNNTTRHVMEAAGALIEKGVKTDEIIDNTFYRKTYAQNQILGRALMESILLLDGRMIFSVLSKKDMTIYGVNGSDLDGIIDQLRVTQGVECALLLYEKEERQYKASMRSNGKVDVSRIAMLLGGGGHVRAAGCTIEGQPRDIVNHIAEQVEAQLVEAKAL